MQCSVISRQVKDATGALLSLVHFASQVFNAEYTSEMSVAFTNLNSNYYNWPQIIMRPIVVSQQNNNMLSLKNRFIDLKQQTTYTQVPICH